MAVRKIVTFLIPILLLTASILLGSILLLRLFYLSILLLFLSYIWTILSLRKVNVSTSIPPDQLQIGNSFGWRVKIKNGSRLPQLFLQVSYRTDIPGVRESAVINIPRMSSYEWVITVKTTKRGRYLLGPVELKTEGPFGVFSRTRMLGDSRECIVYPATIDLPLFKSSSFNDYESGGRLGSSSHHGPDAYSVRDFTSGDSLHHIHWPSTARTGKMMVKLLEADRSYNAFKTSWVLLDMDKDSHCVSGDEASEERAVTIAASVIKKHLQGGMKIGLLACGDSTLVIDADRGDDHFWKIMKALATIKTAPTPGLNELISKTRNIFRNNSLVIVVATSTTRNLHETVRKFLDSNETMIIIYQNLASWNGGQTTSDRIHLISQLGAQVYVVNKGDELSHALDSKAVNLRTIPAS